MTVYALMAPLLLRQKIVEAEGFRLVEGGRTKWEVLGGDAGVQMVFRRDGKDAIRLIVTNEVVNLRFESTDGSVAQEIVLTDEVYADSVSRLDKETTMNRRMFRDRTGRWHVEHGSSADGSLYTDRTGLGAISTQYVCGKNVVGWSVENGTAAVQANVEQDIGLDLHVGRPPHACAIVGDVVRGASVSLTNKSGNWSWSSK
ncbi:MAG TPA: hypothetical protein VFZ65_12265 [Planctomycetota bacterium]|nr:hypothetical protein [Planctomycetota bacterium]